MTQDWLALIYRDAEARTFIDHFAATAFTHHFFSSLFTWFELPCGLLAGIVRLEIKLVLAWAVFHLGRRRRRVPENPTTRETRINNN